MPKLEARQRLRKEKRLPGEAPGARRRDPGAGETVVLGLAITLEETGVGAYNGAAPRLQSDDYLDAFGSIVQVEARHAGALRELAGRNPAPAAFDRALTGPQVLRAVRPFVRSGP